MRAAGLLVALLASAPQTAAAFACKIAPEYPELELLWPDRNLSFGVHASGGVDPTVAQAAFAAWAAPDCSDVRFTYVGLVSADDPVSQVTALDVGWAAAGFPVDAVAITETRFDPATGRIDGADIVLNRDLFTFGDVDAGCGTSTYDTLSVLTHEVGHYVGLGHTRAFTGGVDDPTMAPQVGACDTSKRTLADDDVAGLCHLYEAGAPSRGCGGLDLGLVVPEGGSGCRSGAAGGPVGLALLVLCFARRRRSGATCPRVRSRG